MKRTTIMLPSPLKAKALRRARKLGISLGEFIRRSLEKSLRESAATPEEDPLLSDDEVHEGEVPPGLSTNHDEHLYGRRS